MLFQYLQCSLCAYTCIALVGYLGSVCGICNSLDCSIKSSNESLSGGALHILFKAQANSLSFYLITWSSSWIIKSSHSSGTKLLGDLIFFGCLYTGVWPTGGSW